MLPWKFITTFFIDQDFKFYKITSHTQPTQATIHPVTLVPSSTGIHSKTYPPKTYKVIILVQGLKVNLELFW